MSKDDEIRNISVRRKNIFFLIQRYLKDSGCFNTAEALKAEARLPEEYELCDNIDLDAIYLEYASYYQLKFGKFPKILRKAGPLVKLEVGAGKQHKKTRPQAPPAAKEAKAVESNELQVTVKRIETEQETPATNPQLLLLQEVEHGDGTSCRDQLLNCSAEWQNLADLVKSTILDEDIKLAWSDLQGNAAAVETVKEAVLVPLKYPQLFVQGLRPWRSVLLHGPPGSGKTLLAKILYAETRGQATFFNVTSSIIVSKWRGESEKLLRILFHLAQKHAPSIIFLDEIEGLTSKRDRPSDHESSKRFKNELLQLLDGMEQRGPGVFVLASTNLPWDIDEAFLRRFEKKMLVELPNPVERAKLIGKLLPVNVQITKEKMELLVRLSDSFTGDEIRLACKEIAMQAVRRIMKGNKPGEEAPLEQAFHLIKPLSLKLMRKHVQWQRENAS